MSTRGNPFEELERLLERMSRQFDDASSAWEADDPFARWTSESESMATDLIEHDDEFVVTVDLPGFTREDVDVRVTDHTLRIEIDHEESTEEEDEQYLRHERRRESMHRSIRLPDEVDPEQVAARMKNGVLTVTLPKAAAEEARQIEIDGE